MSDDDWTLTPIQYDWFFRHKHVIDAWAHAGGDDEYAAASVDELIYSDKFAELFGDMSFDEALDRFECMLEDED